MTIAPNETKEGNIRKIELQKLQEIRQLTLAELKELQQLCQVATSHLSFNIPHCRSF